MADLTRLKADIDFMKLLAVDGSSLPLNSGWPLFLAGLIFGAAALLHYMVLSFGALDIQVTGLIWGGAMLVYAISIILWWVRHRAGLQIQGNRNRSIGTVWGCIGFSIFLLSLILSILVWRLESPTLMAVMMPLVLVLYGLGWMVTSEVSAQRWMAWIGGGCFIFAPLLAWLSLRPEQLLLYALALVCFAGIPGWILLRSEKLPQ